MSSTHSSGAYLPVASADGENELHAPAQLATRLTTMPPDKIIFPRRMLYIEAVLYVLIAAASFGLGYLAARSGGAKTVGNGPAADTAENRVPLKGTVMVNKSGKKEPDAGAIVIVLKSDKPHKLLEAAKFRPAVPPTGPDESALRALAGDGGAATRVGGDGRFTLFVPRPGTYRILIISAHGMREAFQPTLRSDLKDLGIYFDDPSELLQGSPYKWYSKDLQPGTKPIEVLFTE